jgi:tryptophan halogenase
MTDYNSSNDIKSIVIAGGGTAGWMTAAGLCSVLSSLNLKIILIESEQIGTVGVGEATLPHIRFYNQKLGIDENELMRATKATYKLGIEFKNWGKLGDSYIHPFGDYGLPEHLGTKTFHHYVTQVEKSGHSVNFDDFSLPVVAARQGRFQFPHPDKSNVLSTFGYAYQFDAGLYAKFLRNFCEDRGVKRVEGKIVKVQQNDQTGNIEGVTLTDGQTISADFFVDCTGFRGLLISETLNSNYQDWTKYLPCNRAVTAACESKGPILPYTRATAKEAGWQWRIPLQHRVGNGYVYSSEFISDEDAEASMLADLETPQISDAKHLRFTTGQREKAWVKNCVAIGLSGGFLEPLESTGIYLIQEAITNFIELFPIHQDSEIARREYNRIMNLEFERVRDFLLLHYVATTRSDTPFWRHLTSMDLPDSLAHKMDLFKSTGRIVTYETGAFKLPSWLSVYYGQNIIPQNSAPLPQNLSEEALENILSETKFKISNAVSTMTSHETFIDQNCRA